MKVPLISCIYTGISLLSIGNASGKLYHRDNQKKNAGRMIDVKEGSTLKRFHPESVDALVKYRDEECQWNIVEDMFGPWKSIRKRIDVRKCVLSECILPAQTKDGNGYIHIHRVGPKEMNGDIKDGLGCQFVTHLGPVGSYLKAYMPIPVDVDTNETLSFPPIHIHHVATNIGSRDEYMNWDSQIPSQSMGNPVLEFESAHSMGGVPVASSDVQCADPDDVTNGMGCLYTSLTDGHGWKVSKDRGPQISQVYVEDYRTPGAPILRVAFDVITVWITEPKQKMTEVVPASFGVWGHGPLSDGHPLLLPTHQASVTMGSFTVPWKANFTNFYYHMHSVAGDEGWLIKGKVADVLQPPKDVANTFYSVSPNVGYGEWNPDYALPVGKLGYGEDISMEEVKSMWRRKIELSGKSNDANKVEFLCQYQSNAVTVPKDNEPLVQAQYGAAVRSGKVSAASRTHWRPGQYYRYGTESGPSCDTFEIEAGEPISLLHFSKARNVDAHVHVMLLGFIHFDDEQVQKSLKQARKTQI